MSHEERTGKEQQEEKKNRSSRKTSRSKKDRDTAKKTQEAETKDATDISIEVPKPVEIRVDLKSNKTGYIIDPKVGIKTKVKFVNKVEIGLVIIGIPINRNDIDTDECSYFKPTFETSLKVQPIGIKEGIFWCQGRINTAVIENNELIGWVYL